MATATRYIPYIPHSVKTIGEELDLNGYGDDTGGRNLFKEYTTWNGYYLSSDTYNGYPIIASSLSWRGAYDGNVTLKAGKTYTISAYVKAESGNIYIFASDTQDRALASISGNGSWRLLKCTYTPTTEMLRVRIENNLDVLTQIACFQIEAGSTATPYHPFIKSNKQLTEEIDISNLRQTELKVLGWNVDERCPIQNKIDGDKFVQYVGRVDMSSLGLEIVSSTGHVFGAVGGYLTDMKIASEYNKLSMIYCNGYTTKPSIYNEGYENFDNVIWQYYNTNLIRIINKSANDLDTLRKSLQGKYLYYELATPITHTIDGREKTELLADAIADVKFLGWSVPEEMELHNYVDKDGKFHQRVQRVDLGSLSWVRQASNGVFWASLSNYKFASDVKAFMYKYPYNGTTSSTSNVTNKTFNLYFDSGAVPRQIYINDTAYSDIDSFKSAIQGVYLYYELATELTISEGNETTENLKVKSKIISVTTSSVGVVDLNINNFGLTPDKYVIIGAETNISTGDIVLIDWGKYRASTNAWAMRFKQGETLLTNTSFSLTVYYVLR